MLMTILAKPGKGKVEPQIVSDEDSLQDSASIISSTADTRSVMEDGRVVLAPSLCQQE